MTSGSSQSEDGRGEKPSHGILRRELGIPGATFMGLGAMMGTGVFVSIGVGAGVTGPSVVAAIAVAAVVALCNALSSAQLAASHPVSGGTYEYGYRYLTPAIGFSAGWFFLCAKSASAATAALGFAGYLIHALGLRESVPPVPVALAVSAAVTVLVLAGLRRSSAVNILVVSVTLAALGVFAVFALPEALGAGRDRLAPLLPAGDDAARRFLEACALMFVAYTGYGRIATMGEEVKEPRRVIPRAILAAMAAAAVVYIAVAIAAVGAIGADALGSSTREEAAPLEIALRALNHPSAAVVVSIGAITAMLGVLLNLILGLSRVALAMGRRGDLPSRFAALDRGGSTPAAAVILVGAVVTALTLLGDVKLTWSFSAFTVLIYYGLTNLAALKLPPKDRLYPRFIAWGGLLACFFLAFWVEAAVWLAGLGVLAAGHLWRLVRLRMAR